MCGRYASFLATEAHFTKNLKAARKPINARAETIAGSGLFQGALTRRSCLVPADAFYEWQAMPDGKQPYAIARQDGQPMAFAGLWEAWRAPPTARCSHRGYRSCARQPMTCCGSGPSVGLSTIARNVDGMTHKT